MAYSSSFLLLYIAIFVIAVPIAIGVYVYRDAGRRGMNAVLWTLIAVLAPALIGFIIYILARGAYSPVKCPSCAEPVMDHYITCPKCGVKLRASCPGCGNLVAPDWKVCPKCAATLPRQNYDNLPLAGNPDGKKDNASNKIILLVILIPVAILIALVAILAFSNMMLMQAG